MYSHVYNFFNKCNKLKTKKIFSYVMKQYSDRSIIIHLNEIIEYLFKKVIEKIKYYYFDSFSKL